MITQAQSQPGEIPVVAGGTVPTYFHDTSNRPAGTITISASGANAGYVNYWHRPIFASDCSTVRADGINVDSRFMYHQLLSKQHLINGLRSGAAQPHVYAKDIAQLQVSIPSFPEQLRIAAILDQADALRLKRREALAQLDSLTQSIFIEMFGDPSTNSQSWPVSALKELGKITTGGTPRSSLEGMFGGDIPFVTPGDLESGKPAKRTVTEAGALEAGTVRAGASLVCCIGATIGKIDMASNRSSFNQQLNSVEWSQDIVDDLYGLTVLKFFKPTIIAWGASTTLPILKKSSFEKIAIPVPPLHLQKDFSRKLLSLEKLIKTVKAYQAEANELFDSLQSRAFSGEL
jgi:type I restriction enzyme S subunit